RNAKRAYKLVACSAYAAHIDAAILAVTSVEPFVTLRLVTSSAQLYDALTVRLLKLEDGGWDTHLHGRLPALVAHLRHRSAPTFLRCAVAERDPTMAALVELANGCPLDAAEPALLQEPLPGYLPVGTRLQALTQKLAYRSIRQRHPKPERRSTTVLIGRILETAAEDWQCCIRAADLWCGIRVLDFRRAVRDFWWLALHDALRVGRYWERIPGYERRATCAHCGVQESLEHILTECAAPGCSTVWAEVSALLRRKNIQVPNLAFGSVMAAPALCVRGRRGATRLLRIVLVESVHLIWRLRCERVIQRNGEPDDYHSLTEIRRRWCKAINDRLSLDQSLVRLTKSPRRLHAQLVLDTWSGTLMNEQALPDNWIGSEGVLVGSLAAPPRGDG
ncbi:hypothetical protein FKP32DRAFT_1559330, partial [Trametes sanguinea]